jgi:chromosome segregation ATPase
MDDREEAGAEELAALQDQLAEARTEIERLQAGTADAAAAAETLRGELRVSLDAAAAQAADAAALREQLDAATERGRADAARYRDALLSGDPSLPAELLAGDSVAAVEASAEGARTLVERGRAQLDELAQLARVPAGAPQRGAPDTGAMSAAQKISYGLARREAG